MRKLIWCRACYDAGGSGTFASVEEHDRSAGNENGHALLDLEFTKRKETKDTIIYEEVERPGQPPIVGSLHVKKFAANGAERAKVPLEIG